MGDLMELSKKNVWMMFDAICESYDRVNRVLSLGIDQYWRRAVSRYLPSDRELSLLDLATGTGDQLFALMRKNSRIVKASGIDLSEKMLGIAEKKVKKQPFCDKVEFRHASATELPFSDASFDLATISFGIRNVDDIEKCFAEMHRTLKKGGRAAILEFSLPKNPLLKKFHLFYLRRVLPYVGGLFSRNKKAYLYLNKTIELFPYGEAFCSLMEKAGFSDVKAVPMTFGIATLYIGDKR
jgi:demethylmenaquinone methyltransferase / 2-methoxy-6-polyprenyl-1,4-benzoquinol methylase